MGISKSTYYHKPFKDDLQLKKDLALKNKIEEIHKTFPGYGYRRIHEHLLREGIAINCKRIRRVMKQFSLFSSRTKLMKQRGKKIGKRLVHPDLIAGLTLTGPDQVWATDITYIRLEREYVYLSAVIDIYTRLIVGWAVSRDLSHKFCIDAMRVAIQKRKPEPGVIHHSDRGVQYVSEGYMDFLNKHGFRPSMSKVATPEENAFIEAFFKTLKREEVYARDYRSMRDVIKNLPKFIDEIYNLKRLHSSIGYLPPDEFEKEVMKLKPADRPTQKIWGKVV